MADDGLWLHINEAARRLGVTPQAIRGRVNRGTVQSRRSNSGSLLVLMSGTPPQESATAPIETLHSNFNSNSNSEPQTGRVDADRADQLLKQLISSYKDQIAASERRRESECAILQERVDAAEIRAERAEKLALDALTQAADTAERITKSLIDAASKPLWRRLFG